MSSHFAILDHGVPALDNENIRINNETVDGTLTVNTEVVTGNEHIMGNLIVDGTSQLGGVVTCLSTVTTPSLIATQVQALNTLISTTSSAIGGTVQQSANTLWESLDDITLQPVTFFNSTNVLETFSTNITMRQTGNHVALHFLQINYPVVTSGTLVSAAGAIPAHLIPQGLGLGLSAKFMVPGVCTGGGPVTYYFVYVNIFQDGHIQLTLPTIPVGAFSALNPLTIWETNIVWCNGL